jgi:hypothetical protein
VRYSAWRSHRCENRKRRKRMLRRCKLRASPWPDRRVSGRESSAMNETWRSLSVVLKGPRRLFIYSIAQKLLSVQGRQRTALPIMPTALVMCKSGAAVWSIHTAAGEMVKVMILYGTAVT